MTYRVYYCNAVLAGAKESTIDKLQRVLNIAARLITGAQKLDEDSVLFITL